MSSTPARTSLIDGGGDTSVISGIFSLLSLCATYVDKDSSNGESKLCDRRILVLRSCLTLASIAHYLKSSGETYISCVLTSNPKKQRAYLSLIAHLSSCDDGASNPFQPHFAAAMLALASLISLENDDQGNSNISQVALPLIPPTATLMGYLRHFRSTDSESSLNVQGAFSNLHGLVDGYVGLLEKRLKWGGPQAIEQAYSSGVPDVLIYLLIARSQKYDNTRCQGGLSPVGVVWAISSLCYFLPDGAYHEILFEIEPVRLMCHLLDKVHLNSLKCWNGPGGGTYGIRDRLNVVIDLLAFPFVVVQSAPGAPGTTASIISGSFLNVGSPGTGVNLDNQDFRVIQAKFKHFTDLLLKVRPFTLLSSFVERFYC